MKFKEFIDYFIEFHNNNKDYNEPLFKVLSDIKNDKQNYGLCLEFGVWNGHTISYIAKELPNWKIYGFDSFEGLPEAWSRPDDQKYIKGYFSTNGRMPSLSSNINLIKGWFDETLPVWISNHTDEQINLLHVDCDIYSSTQTVLNYCKPLIASQTIIIFDELITYPNFENHEIKAFYEFIQYSNLKFKILYSGGYNLEKVAIIIQ